MGDTYFSDPHSSNVRIAANSITHTLVLIEG